MHHRDGAIPICGYLTLCGLLLGGIPDHYIHQHHKGALMRKLLKNTHGGALVEYALVALPVLVFVFGIMQTAWIVWVDNLLQMSVDAAARCGAVGSLTSPCAGSTTADMIQTANTVFEPLSGASFSVNN